MRSKAYWDEVILTEVAMRGGFSIYWVTSNKFRAKAAQRLKDAGRIEPTRSKFPWCGYKLCPAGERPCV